METYWWSAFALGHLSLVIEFHLSQGNMDHPDCFHSNYSVHLVWKGRVLGGEREALKPPPTQPSFSPTKPGKGWWEGTRSLKYQKDLWRQGQSPEGLHPMTTTVSLLPPREGVAGPSLGKTCRPSPPSPKAKRKVSGHFFRVHPTVSFPCLPYGIQGSMYETFGPPNPEKLGIDVPC